MQNKPLQLEVFGASGRLGSAIVSLAKTDPRFAFSNEPDLFIDARIATGLETRLQTVLEKKLPLVIGTTGLSSAQQELLIQASVHIPLFYTPNFSLGMALLQKLAAEVAKKFPADIDILESHHKHKKDIPSGSAKLLAQAVGGTSPIHSIRAGEIFGEHTLFFNAPEERLTLTHTVHSRTAFARGALEAAIFLASQSPGFYTMQDLLCTPCA